jgi:hypothetical protein
VFNSWKDIELVQKPNIEAVLLGCLQVRIDVNTTTTVAEIKRELLKREKRSPRGFNYRLRLRSEDGEQWKEIYNLIHIRNYTLLVDTSLPGPVIHADLFPTVGILVSTLNGIKFNLAPSKIQPLISSYLSMPVKEFLQINKGLSMRVANSKITTS